MPATPRLRTGPRHLLRHPGRIGRIGRSGHGRRPLPDHLPREGVEYDVAKAEKACRCCGKARVRIGAETSVQLGYRPASLFVGYPDPDCSAHVAVSKYADHLPLYRQHGILARDEVDLSQSTLWDWVAAAADLLRPIVVRMADLVRQSRVFQTDDIPVPVLDPRSQQTKTGHLWVYLGDADHLYSVFDFTTTYSGDGLGRGWGTTPDTSRRMPSSSTKPCSTGPHRDPRRSGASPTPVGSSTTQG